MSSTAIPPASALRTKVVHLVTMLELGGAQGNTIHTVRHLDQNHFDAHLWCGRGGFWDEDVKKDLGAKGRLRFLRHLVRPVRPGSDLLAILELWLAFRQEKPDIVHTHSSKAGIVGRIAAMLAGVPVIVHTFHGFGFHDHQPFVVRRLYIAIERWVARFTDRLIFVSESNWKIGERHRLGDPSRYLLIRSGVALQRLAQIKRSLDRARTREQLGLAPDAKVVTTLSAFKPQKNLQDFIEMARRVGENEPQAVFVLIGDGELRPALEALAVKKGVKERVRMPGWITDPATFLAASDVFVLTSLWEGLPRALVESLALGVPAVCYETDGVTDLLSSPEELRPREDVKGLSAAVSRLLGDPAAAQRLAASQGSRITPDFDIVEMVRQQEMLYLNLAGRSRA